MNSKEAAENFLDLLQQEVATFNNLISTENGDWSVKGFIDVFKNIYTISGDTKVVSKLIEIMLFPQFVAFAAENNLKLILSREQNHYPDLTFIDSQEHKFAVDLKSTYRVTNTPMNTMTLGAFTTKNIGAVNTISDLLKGTGPFASLGEEVFDDYWMYYLTSDMARQVDLKKPPYHNLATYFEYEKAPQGG